MKALHMTNDLTVMNKLARANSVIDKFINGCSHSMRGPLKTIRGLVNIISEDNTPEKKSVTILDLIEKTASHMENILNQLEQFLENSKKEVKVEQVDIAEIISEVQSKYQRALDQHSIEVTIRIHDKETLLTDKERLKIILFQIFSNAISFCDPNKAKRMILIEARIFNSSFEIAVRDNGVGIEPECSGKIFQLFYRASEKSKGAGIGLYIVKEIIEKMKGIVSVQSQLSSGSNFLIWLPNLN